MISVPHGKEERGTVQCWISRVFAIAEAIFSEKFKLKVFFTLFGNEECKRNDVVLYSTSVIVLTFFLDNP